jgi:hypothetical protein
LVAQRQGQQLAADRLGGELSDHGVYERAVEHDRDEDLALPQGELSIYHAAGEMGVPGPAGRPKPPGERRGRWPSASRAEVFRVVSGMRKGRKF